MDELPLYFIKNPVIRSFPITHDLATCKEHLQVREGLGNLKLEDKGRGKKK
ncbi:MAG: hypothetical protein HZB40_20490 [Rhodocyclales bacterium]|nr:hypothetical protein [Rhodocyclales bacterium]